MPTKQQIAKELVKMAKELVATDSNLGNPNTYFRVVNSFKLFILVGHEPSNAWYGNARIFKPLYKEIVAKKGDEIRNLWGGLFFVSNGKMWNCQMEVPEFKPFERGRSYLRFPLEKLEQIPEGTEQRAKAVVI
jgi:hypothetical protein